MVREQPAFFRPPLDADVSVWRYMDLTKFLWMLQNKALYFASVPTMNDRYEGHYPQPLAPSEKSEEAFIRRMCERPNSPFSIDREDHREALRTRFRNHLKEDLPGIAERFYVSCWHMNEE